tara:strand:+ start:148 stop:387 length:240 start_codon:yes stop_codon:yes gene_type:complete
MTKVETEVIEKLANSQVAESLKQAVLRLLASHGRTTANHKSCLERIKELREEIDALNGAPKVNRTLADEENDVDNVAEA